MRNRRGIKLLWCESLWTRFGSRKNKLTLDSILLWFMFGLMILKVFYVPNSANLNSVGFVVSINNRFIQEEKNRKLALRKTDLFESNRVERNDQTITKPHYD